MAKIVRRRGLISGVAIGVGIANASALLSAAILAGAGHGTYSPLVLSASPVIVPFVAPVVWAVIAAIGLSSAESGHRIVVGGFLLFHYAVFAYIVHVDDVIGSQPISLTEAMRAVPFLVLSFSFSTWFRLYRYGGPQLHLRRFTQLGSWWQADSSMRPNTSFQRTQTARLFGPLNSDR